MVDGGEEGAEARVAEGAQELLYLAAGQDVGQRLVAGDLDLLPDVPAALEVAVVEVAQAADGLVDGAAREPAAYLEVDEEVEDLVGDEVGHVPLGVVAGELPRPVEVDLARAFGDAYELDIALEVSVPWQRCDGGGLRRCFVSYIVFLCFIACEYGQTPSAHQPSQEGRRAAAPFNKTAHANPLPLRS